MIPSSAMTCSSTSPMMEGCHPREGAPLASSPVSISSSTASDSPSEFTGLAAPAGTLRSGLGGTAEEDAMAAPAAAASAADLVAAGAGAGKGPVGGAVARSPETCVVLGAEAEGGEAMGARLPIVSERRCARWS